MKNKPKISVIMSAYNTEKYIAEAIESILNQTLRDFELIIINDASTDNTLDIIKKYTKKDKRIKVISLKKNVGAAEARNMGLKIANGKYIAIMDSDDISLPERFRIQYNYLEKNKNIFLLAGGFYHINTSGEVINQESKRYNSKQIKEILIKRNVLHNPTLMFRNEDNIFYREKFVPAEDYDLLLRLLSNNKNMYLLPDILIKYRVHPSSYTSSSGALQSSNMSIARSFYFERKKSKKDSYKTMNPYQNLTKKNKCIKNAELTVKTREIKFFFRNKDNMDKFRVLIRNFWKSNGFFSWKKSYIYYLISFSPKKVLYLFRRFIWK